MYHRVFAVLGLLIQVSWVSAQTLKVEVPYPPLPEGVSSFGAAVSQDWLFVYGGHCGKTHEYSTKTVSGAFRRLDLRNGKAWEDLPAGPILQGLALVASEGKLYRLGGMQPQNQPGEKTNNRSTAECARYDPAQKKWSPIPDLPTPRSSFDAVVLDDKIFVFGGWHMLGAGQPSQWLDHGLVLDLHQEPLQWKKIPQPFQRRALTVSTFNNHIYILGGMDDDDAISMQVDIFHPQKNQWSQGPVLPGKKRNGFSPAACELDGQLWLTMADGKLVTLKNGGKTWEERLDLQHPRIVHRMLPTPENTLVVVGGASKEGNVAVVEKIHLR